MAWKNTTGRGPSVPSPSTPSSSDEARRVWGQNFFRSASSARRFAEQLEGSGGLLTIEIGPGSGRITRELASSERPLVAVEVDPHWAGKLDAESLPNVTVVNRDFLTWRLPAEPVQLIGNLPFGSGTTILRHCLELGPDRMRQGVFLLQREYVRKRTGTWGGNLLNAQWEPWYEFREGLGYARNEFAPVPNADTATLLIDPYRRPTVPWEDRVAYQELVRLIFESSRLTIGEAARHLVRRGHAEWLRRAGVQSTLRVKDLNPREWAGIFRTYEKPQRPAPSVGRPRQRRR